MTETSRKSKRRSIKRLLSGLLFLASGCHGSADRADDRAVRVDDPPASTLSFATASAPTAEQVEQACDDAIRRSIRQAEAGGAIVDPSYYAYPVRNPVCTAVPGPGAALACRFQQAEIAITLPTAEQRREALKRMRPSDWKPYRARLVYNGSSWTAPEGCEGVPKPAPG